MQQLFCDENLVWMILVNVARLDEAGKKMFLFGTFAWGRTEKWKDLKHARRRDLVRHVSQRQSIRMNLLSSREHTKRKKRRSRIFRSTITNQHELKNNTNHQSEWHKTFHGETTKIKILSHKKLRRASPRLPTPPTPISRSKHTTKENEMSDISNIGLGQRRCSNVSWSCEWWRRQWKTAKSYWRCEARKLPQGRHTRDGGSYPSVFVPPSSLFDNKPTTERWTLNNNWRFFYSLIGGRYIYIDINYIVAPFHF